MALERMHHRLHCPKPLTDCLTAVRGLYDRAFFQATFKQLQAGLFAQSPQAFAPAVFSFPHFLWAVAAVRGRSHAPLDGAKIALVPLADMVSPMGSQHARAAGAAGRGGPARQTACAGRRPSSLV